VLSLARRIPEAPRGAIDKQRTSIRRRYKKNLNTRRKVLPGQQEFVTDMVLVLKLVNYSNTQIGNIVGISRNQVSQELEKPEVAERLMKLQKNIAGAAYDLLQTYLIEAVQTLVDIMRTEKDNMIVLKAAAEILDRAGMPKASRTESTQNRTVTEEMKLTADEEMMAAFRQLAPEVQEEAAQMIEGLQTFLEEHKEKPSEESA
jgi:predicted transcriptional regulator